MAAAQERETADALECTFSPTSFAQASYQPPHTPPRHVAHACAGGSPPATPPMTIPAVVLLPSTAAPAVAVAAGAAVPAPLSVSVSPAPARGPSSLSPLRQRGSGVVVPEPDMPLSPRR